MSGRFISVRHPEIIRQVFWLKHHRQYLPSRFHSGVHDTTLLLQRRSRVGFAPNFPITPHASKWAPVDFLNC